MLNVELKVLLRPFGALLAFSILIGCKSRSESDSLKGSQFYNIDQAAPTKTMYHYGEYANLRKNSLANHFDLLTWGKITNSYPPHRKGLFVAVHPAYNERYVNHLFEIKSDGSDAPWVMAVDIKDECLTKDKFVRKPWVANQENRMKQWDAARADVFQKSCAIQSPIDSSNYELYETRFEGSNTCSSILSLYLQQNKISVVQDMYWPNDNFWVVLDENCISDMRAEPTEVLQIMKIPEFWTMAPFTTNWNRHQADNARMKSFRSRLPGAHAFYILLRAIYESPDWDAKLMQEIKSEGLKSDIQWTLNSGSVNLGQLISLTIDKGQECQTSGRFSKIRDQIEFYLQKAHTKDNSDLTAAQHGFNFVEYGLKKVNCQTDGVSQNFTKQIPEANKNSAQYRVDFDLSKTNGSETLARLIIINITLSDSDVGASVNCADAPYRKASYICKVRDAVSLRYLQSEIR
ncbi:MAG: hypothetical protein NT027_12495, partial [Proteobacteria bacterium]|nr:hypothetical protein [Pseudomonadota bacterium]